MWGILLESLNRTPTRKPGRPADRGRRRAPVEGEGVGVQAPRIEGAHRRIPPGKAPRAVIETHLGTHAILHEALDRLLPEVYREALEQEEIDPVDRADYELVTEEPLVAKFTVPVRPTIDLGDYNSTLRVEREPVVVEQERVNQAVEELRHRYATLEPADRPIEWGDVITADVKGEANGKAFIEQDDANFPLVEGRDISLPGVAEAFLGHAKGDEFEIEVDIPGGPGEGARRGEGEVHGRDQGDQGGGPSRAE